MSCPFCGGEDVTIVELGEVERDTLYECDNCLEQFTGEEN
jgi:hypothetical protein